MNNTPVILVWDTNAVDCIVRGIEFFIRNARPPGTEFERHQEFLTLFELVFDQLRSSLDHINHTSDRVFSEEIDPRLVGCHLRNGKALIEAYCGDGGFAGQWSASIENRMPCEEVEDEEIALFQELTQVDLGNKDLSLIVAALKLANAVGRNAVVVTDDQALAEEILRLRRTHNSVDLDGRIYSTNLVGTMFSIEVLRTLHNSCGIDSQMWWYIIISFLQHHGQREVNAAREKEREAVAYIEEYRRDRDAKDELKIRRELEQRLGGSMADAARNYLDSVPASYINRSEPIRAVGFLPAIAVDRLPSIRLTSCMRKLAGPSKLTKTSCYTRCDTRCCRGWAKRERTPSRSCV